MHHERMILPYQLVKDGRLMAKNLAKYFRIKFALRPKQPDKAMLQNVSFKIFKVENVPPFKNDPDKRTELKARAVQTPDLCGGNVTHQGLIDRGGELAVRVSIGYVKERNS